MRHDAEEHAEEDRRQFELAEARNKGQHLIYQLEKQINENSSKLTDADRQPMTAAIGKLKSAIAGTELDAIRSATSELEQAAQAFSKVLYEKSSATANEAGSSEAKSGAAGGDDDAIDAEFEVKE
jgi:molecular chaperone DnaK